jgi:hypothetical protein
VEGSLSEITDEQAEVMKQARRQEERRARTLDELIAIGHARGYKNPRYWAQQKMAGRGQSRRPGRPVSAPKKGESHASPVSVPLFCD